MEPCNYHKNCAHAVNAEWSTWALQVMPSAAFAARRYRQSSAARNYTTGLAFIYALRSSPKKYTYTNICTYMYTYIVSVEQVAVVLLWSRKHTVVTMCLLAIQVCLSPVGHLQRTGSINNPETTDQSQDIELSWSTRFRLRGYFVALQRSIDLPKNECLETF